MAAAAESVTTRPAWKALAAHYQAVRGLHLRKLFADDAQRGERMTVEAAGINLDYSKNRITDETIKLLLRLAEESGVRARIDAMFRGEKINVSEQRAVLHVALRAPKGTSIVVDGENVVPQVHAVLDKMTAFANRVRGGDWKGHTGKRIRNVINIGIARPAIANGRFLERAMSALGRKRTFANVRKRPVAVIRATKRVGNNAPR